MSTLKDAIKWVEGMEADELALHQQPEGGDEFGARAGGLDDMGTLDEPMEPPVSDAAIGADTEGETALGLLRQMKDLLGTIATAVAPEEMAGPPDELGAEGGAGGGMPNLGAEGEMPGEPPPEMAGEGEGGEGGKTAGEFEPEEEEPAEEEGQTRPVPKKKEKEED